MSFDGKPDNRFTPSFDQVLDTLVRSSGIALLSILKMAMVSGKGRFGASGKFRLDAFAKPMMQSNHDAEKWRPMASFLKGLHRWFE